jgi:hypothetical protein
MLATPELANGVLVWDRFVRAAESLTPQNGSIHTRWRPACPAAFTAETEAEVMKHIELHGAVAHGEGPGEIAAGWRTEKSGSVRTVTSRLPPLRPLFEGLRATMRHKRCNPFDTDCGARL